MWKWKRKWTSQTCERETQGRGGVTWTFTIRNERAKTFKSAPLKIKDKKRIAILNRIKKAKKVSKGENKGEKNNASN